MSDETGELQVELTKALSSSWIERIHAGRNLALCAGTPEASDALVQLLQDSHDTAVIRQTSKALVECGTVDAVRVLAFAISEANDIGADWIQTGVQDALAGLDDVSDFAAICRQLAHGAEGVVYRGALELLAWVDDMS